MKRKISFCLKTAARGVGTRCVVGSFFVQRSFGWSSSLASDTGGMLENPQNDRLVGRDFLNLKHFKADDIKRILWTAKDLKTRFKDGEIFQPLKGKTAAMIFEERSQQTRLSTELGIVNKRFTDGLNGLFGLAKLGGHATRLGPKDMIHVNKDGSIGDTARMLNSMADIIVAGMKEQQSVDKMADEASVPVISGQTNLFHPLPTLAIFMTLQEFFGYLQGCKIAWVGGGSNILHSLIYGCARLGVDLSVACPPGYEPDADVTFDAMRIAGKTGASFQISNNVLEAVYRADAIVTDAWPGVGQGEETHKQFNHFDGFRITRKILKEAGGTWVFLHCLPHGPEEVADDIFHGEESLVWRQAENRMWTVMSVMLSVLQPYTPTIPMPKVVRG